MTGWLRGVSLVAGLAALGTAALAQSVGAASYGAIAFSPRNGAFGYSYNYGTRDEAEARALRECRVRGGGCRLMVWFRNACGALAVGEGYAYGWAWASSRGEARGRAMEECRARTRGCDIRVLVCTAP